MLSLCVFKNDVAKSKNFIDINLFYLLTAWCIEIIGKKLDLNTIRPDELSGHLRRFYAEAQPKNCIIPGHKNASRSGTRIS